jgi:hypothetical protein
LTCRQDHAYISGMENRHIAAKAAARVEEVRRAIEANKERWPEMCGMNGTNERWLRAFVEKQFKQPPADRFLSIERWLVENRLVTKRV